MGRAKSQPGATQHARFGVVMGSDGRGVPAALRGHTWQQASRTATEHDIRMLRASAERYPPRTAADMEQYWDSLMQLERELPDELRISDDWHSLFADAAALGVTQPQTTALKLVELAELVQERDRNRLRPLSGGVTLDGAYAAFMRGYDGAELTEIVEPLTDIRGYQMKESFKELGRLTATHTGIVGPGIAPKLGDVSRQADIWAGFMQAYEDANGDAETLMWLGLRYIPEPPEFALIAPERNKLLERLGRSRDNSSEETELRKRAWQLLDAQPNLAGSMDYALAHLLAARINLSDHEEVFRAGVFLDAYDADDDGQRWNEIVMPFVDSLAPTLQRKLDEYNAPEKNPVTQMSAARTFSIALESWDEDVIAQRPALLALRDDIREILRETDSNQP